MLNLNIFWTGYMKKHFEQAIGKKNMLEGNMAADGLIIL